MIKNTVCQVCQIHCTMQACVENGVVTDLRGDKNDPAYRGYSCIKGREVNTTHHLPSRLTHPLRLNEEGIHEPVASSVATANIGHKLRQIIAEHGPRSVAMYIGTYGMCNLLSFAFGQALMRGIGSRMIFQPQTIDQPGKGIGMGLHGIWLAGIPAIADWDALLLVGTNPLISMNGGLGPNPALQLHQAQKRGLQLIVIDPRRSETARKAQLHLQCRPGEDAVLLAAIARELLINNLVDKAFIASECEGLETLEKTLAPFTPELAGARADVDPDDIRKAAAILGQAKCGALGAGTGANMSGNGCLTEYLVRVITSLRGWWLREGKQRPNPGVLIEPLPAIAASPGPTPCYDLDEKLRIRGLGETNLGMPTAALADEILLPGEGQVKALIVLGGNPVAAWPDQLKTDKAMQALDLLVCLDPRMTETCKHAHYVIPPKLQLEVETNSAANELWGSMGLAGWGYDTPYAIACPPVIEPPPNAHVEEEWETLLAIAGAMGMDLDVHPVAILDPERAAQTATRVSRDDKPTSHTMWQAILQSSPVPYEEICDSDTRLFQREEIISAKPGDWSGRMALASPPMMNDLERLASPANRNLNDDFPFRLISRRMNDMHNSNWHDNQRQQRRYSYNPAFLHPSDMTTIDLAAGELIEIRSRHGGIVGIAQPDPDLRPGCVSMSNGWGAAPGTHEDPFTDGANTSRLTATDEDWDRYCGIPIMSAIPVALCKRQDKDGSAGYCQVKS